MAFAPHRAAAHIVLAVTSLAVADLQRGEGPGGEGGWAPDDCIIRAVDTARLSEHATARVEAKDFLREVWVAVPCGGASGGHEDAAAHVDRSIGRSRAGGADTVVVGADDGVPGLGKILVVSAGDGYRGAIVDDAARPLMAVGIRIELGCGRPVARGGPVARYGAIPIRHVVLGLGQRRGRHEERNGQARDISVSTHCLTSFEFFLPKSICVSTIELTPKIRQSEHRDTGGP